MPHIPVRPPFGAAARSKSAVVPICRTLEGLQTLAGFQDQCIQPLCHLSGYASIVRRAFCLLCLRDSTGDLRYIPENRHYFTGFIENTLWQRHIGMQ